MITEKHLPEARRVPLVLTRPTGTDTYCWRQAEVAAILARCRGAVELHWLGDVLTALACTGMRISELAALRWTDIGFEANVIKLTDETAKVGRSDGRKARQIKNRRSRSFPIHEDLRQVLDRLERHSDGRVFHGPRGGVLSPDIARRTLIKEVLKPLVQQFPTPAGETGFEDGRLHSFRHYFCSTCANTGVPEQVVMRWLGHQDSLMVRHYYHLHDDEAQRQMQRVNFVGGSAAKGAAEGTTPYFVEEVTEAGSTRPHGLDSEPVGHADQHPLGGGREGDGECRRPGFGTVVAQLSVPNKSALRKPFIERHLRRADLDERRGQDSICFTQRLEA